MLLNGTLPLPRPAQNPHKIYQAIIANRFLLPCLSATGHQRLLTIYRDKTVNQLILAALYCRIYALYQSQQGYTEQP